jgi:hypothetical protein
MPSRRKQRWEQYLAIGLFGAVCLITWAAIVAKLLIVLSRAF